MRRINLLLLGDCFAKERLAITEKPYFLICFMNPVEFKLRSRR
jgi:hypothetical protein